jgi:tetratricopeptide (TPR) repeat protein
MAAELAATSSDIPESAIAALQKELEEAASATSSTGKRRAYKNVARDGENLLQASPEDPNRWQVLSIMFDSHKYLFSMENSDLNREALLEVSVMLADAPDEYAELRLEADLLLSEKNLSDKEADVAERARALEALTVRYRHTSAEAKCLIIASQIAEKLGDLDLQRNIINTLTDRFAGDPAVIDWCRQNLGVGQMDVFFTGTYTRSDGVTLKFPYDIMGHAYVVVFWSNNTPGVEEYLQHLGELQESLGHVFRVYSFNIDELPDAGQSVLQKLELDWVAMRLPGGRNASAYRTYGQGDPSCLFCNGFGHALLMPSFDANREADPLKRATLELSARRVPEYRHLAQLQSLSIGDFLVTARTQKIDPAFPPEMQMISFDGDMAPAEKLNRTADSVSEESLAAIQACFTPSPIRYRLAQNEALANYRKAHGLCLDALRKYPADPNSWIVRNRLIIALLGMSNLSGEPEYLEQAAVHARKVLAGEVPPAGGVAARFCLTKLAIRQDDAKTKTLLADLIEDSGGAKAPASAYAAAAILALDAHDRGLHEHYRDQFPEWGYDGNPALWQVTSFLRDRFHRFALLKANYIYNRHNSSPRGYIINLGRAPSDIQMPGIELKTLDGKILRIPEDTNGTSTLLVFVEPPEVIMTEPELDAKGNPKPKTPYAIMASALELADRHINKDLNVITAFLCDDPAKIKTMMKVKGWTCQAAIVPGGLANPIVQRLGIQSADRIPNPFLLRRDGTIAWDARGLEYKGAGDTLFTMLLAMKVHIEACEVEYACSALEKGEFKEAARVFGGPYMPWPPDRFGWRPPRYHGQALAYIGLKDWEAALESIEKAIDAQKLRYYQALRYDKDAAKWREQAATVTVNHPDDTLIELWSVKAEILDKIDRKDEAAEMRERAAEPATPDVPSPYKSIHERLKDWLKQHHMELQEP